MLLFAAAAVMVVVVLLLVLMWIAKCVDDTDVDFIILVIYRRQAGLN